MVSVTVDPAPTITSFVANPTTVGPGGSASLTAVFANGTGVITPGNIPVTSGVPVSVAPTITTNYTLTVTNSIGTPIRPDYDGALTRCHRPGDHHFQRHSGKDCRRRELESVGGFRQWHGRDHAGQSPRYEWNRGEREPGG